VSTDALAGTEALLQTPSQTVGPFFGYALPYDGGPKLVPPTAPGAIRLHGTVYDGAGVPVPDAILELWQPDADGNAVRARGSLRRDGFTFTGFGRAAVDADGHYSFATLRPGGEHPYALLTVFARGLMHHLFTRAYFPQTDGTARPDAFLESVAAERRPTLVALPDGPSSYRFDIRLQGDGETVFIDYGVDW
jgi:protocatechuate 3,4-dioxygenase alpha subunit